MNFLFVIFVGVFTLIAFIDVITAAFRYCAWGSPRRVEKPGEAMREKQLGAGPEREGFARSQAGGKAPKREPSRACRAHRRPHRRGPGRVRVLGTGGTACS